MAPESRSLPVSEFEVESEIYESLYGVPRRERETSARVAPRS